MARRRQTMAVLVGGLLALGVAPAAADTMAPGPGFQINLGARGGTHVECFITGLSLSCLDYKHVATPGRCTGGGEVPTVVISRRGRPRQNYTCVDEGFHDWARLRPGRTFRTGPFRCRAPRNRAKLTCRSTISGWRFNLTATGGVEAYF